MCRDLILIYRASRRSGGVAFEITRLITGEIGVGYFQQDYVDPIYTDPDGFDYHAALIWNPTPLHGGHT